ncbi:MAG: redoxin domain-containing protein [Candidatus Acidiferrales bacterium]
MNMRKQRCPNPFNMIFIVAIAALAWFAPARAQDSSDGRLVSFKAMAPEIPPPGFAASGITWLDSPPLTMAGLRGKVVMIDFWEYTCINCIRTFPQNKIWYARYQKYGFEIIGVHDPEFQIAYDVSNVRAAVERFALPYPILVDDKFYVWNHYRNESWPSRFLIDAGGYARYHIDGEGDDRNFELAIRKLLVEAHPGLKFPDSYTLPVDDNPSRSGCGGDPTPEMYVGPWDGRGILANDSGYHLDEKIDFKMPKRVEDGRAAVSGTWETNKNGMIFVGSAQEPGEAASRLRMKYHATELYSVLNVAGGKPEKLYILQDGKYLTAENKGADVKIDAQGRSYIDVDSSRMYYLAVVRKFSSHTVDLIPTAPGLMVDSFTFGNSCQTDFPHN